MRVCGINLLKVPQILKNVTTNLGTKIKQVGNGIKILLGPVGYTRGDMHNCP